MIDDERRAARGRFRARRGAGSAESDPERVNAFSVEEFEAHHEIGDAGTDPSHAAASEPLEVEAEVVVEPTAGTPEAEPAPPAPPAPNVADAEPYDEASIHDVVHLDDPAEVLPALAGVAADLWVRALIWGFQTSRQTGARLARAATDPQAAAELYQDVTNGLRSYAREFLGISELDEQLRELRPLAGATLPQNGRSRAIALREHGARLLRQAADVSFDEGVHPAYARILTELAPDEARILRTLATQGPQPMVDVRETNLIGMGSQLIVSGLNMIGTQAGLRHRDRVDAYLGNLLRLGLIELSDKAVDDAIAYQILEAQPEVLGTIKETPRAKTVHRSLRLTPFGEGFCRICLPLEPASLPAGEPPGQTAKPAQEAMDAPTQPESAR
jgi:hypothetical protein